MPRGAIYTRISKDSAGLGAGVARQEEDCRTKAFESGIEIMAVFSDNDASAYKSTPRPGYASLLASIEAGEVDVVLVWHTDRLYRRMHDLEGYITVCQPRGVPTVACQSGPLDLTQPSGRMVARQLAAVAQYESEQKAVRHARANLQRAKQGKHFGTRRAFGFEMDGVTLRPDEASALREAYDSVIDGVPLAAIAREFNARGLTTPQAKNPWDSTVLGRTLRNHRLAGIRTYQGEVLYVDGQPVKGEWPEIVDLETWQTTQAVLNHPSRKWPAQSRGLLSGVAVCGVCGSPMRSGGTRNGRRRYRCSDHGQHPYREAEPIDLFVAQAVLAYLTRPGIWQQIIPTAPGSDAASIRAEIAALRRRSDGLVSIYSDGLISLQQMKEGQEKITRSQRALEAKLPPPPSPVLSLLSRSLDLEEAWAKLSIDEQRSVIDSLLVVRVKPTRTKEKAYLDWRRRILNPDSLELEWRPEIVVPPPSHEKRRITQF